MHMVFDNVNFSHKYFFQNLIIFCFILMKKVILCDIISLLQNKGAQND